MEIKPEDIAISAWSSKKAGSWSLSVPRGIRLVHLPTGIVVEVDSERGQHKNKAIALEKLKDQLSS